MSTATGASVRRTPDASNAGSLRVLIGLGRRSIVGMLRQPQMVFPSLFFPLLFTALNAASFGKAATLPGFGAPSFLDFAVAGAVIQGVMFGATAAGIDMALDVEDGFFDRLVSSPIARWVVVLGRLVGPAVFAAVQALVFCGIFAAFGADYAGGIGAVAVLVGIAALLAIGVGALFVAIALRTGSSEAVQALFPVVFISLFVSTSMFPGVLMSGWFKQVAEANPVSTLVEGVRHQVLVGFDLARAGQSAAVAGVILVLAMIGAGLALRRRVGMT